MSPYAHLLILLTPHRGKLFIAIFLSIISSAGLLLLPAVVREILGAALGGREISFQIQVWLPIALGLCAITLCGYLAYSIMFDIAHNATATLRTRYVNSLLTVPLGTHRDHKSGDILDRLITSISDIDWFIKYTIIGIITISLMLLSGVVIVLVFSWKLTLLVLTLTPLTAIVLRRLYAKVQHALTRSDQSSRSVTERVKEIINGIEVIKAFHAEQFELTRFEKQQADIVKEEKGTTRLVALIEPVMFSAAIAVLLVVLLVGSRMIATQELQIETLVAFMTYTLLIVPQSRLLSLFVVRWQHFKKAIQNLDEIIVLPREIDLPGASNLPRTLRGIIEFRHITYSYPDRAPALNDVSFTVNEHECVGIVGASGAGKSTLCNLLLRFYQPHSGSIFIDGMNIQNVTAASLRDAIAIIPQDTLLFDTTIIENVRYGNLEATDEEVRTACRAAQADQFIMALPDEYATKVGERGIGLSGGQRQRIAIARALLKNAPIFLFDEATSSIDSHTEFELRATMMSVIKGRTTLIIAHRLATVVHLKHILVLHDGKVIDEGSHEELMGRCPYYGNLVATQRTPAQEVLLDDIAITSSKNQRTTAISI